ncbi:MAG: hypothetical protein ACRD7E_01940, partial [Bryobacteraceae bacterium]
DSTIFFFLGGMRLPRYYLLAKSAYNQMWGRRPRLRRVSRPPYPERHSGYTCPAIPGAALAKACAAPIAGI